MGVTEKRVKEAVQRFFQKQKYYVPRKEFNIGVRPDVVAFKWKNNYEVDAFAVECKKTTNVSSLIETGLTQAREYQTVFPCVYLATIELSEDKRNTLISALKNMRMGLLCMSPKDEEIMPYPDPKEVCYLSPKLNSSEFQYKLRQRAVAILTYDEVYNHRPFDLNVQEPEAVHCYDKDEPANWWLTNFTLKGDYIFGICIEKQANVEKTLDKIKPNDLSESLSILSEEYEIELDYVDTYKPREVSWTVLQKPVKNLSPRDVKWVLDCCRKRKWKTRFMLYRKVWSKGEVLSRNEHLGAVKKVMDDLTPLREVLLSA